VRVGAAVKALGFGGVDPGSNPGGDFFHSRPIDIKMNIITAELKP
jgi:hypothetical protein